jgi:hypothetical protein|tara:strand:+ start:104 stop:403 length:300 start_codon:yes stop_codon:yes gene_type:complete
MKGNFMNKYIATHTFKSEELRSQYFEVAGSMAPADIKAMVTGDKAVCHKNWTNGEKSMKAYCHWEAESPEAIIDQLGDMNNFFHTVSEEMNDEVDFTSM